MPSQLQLLRDGNNLDRDSYWAAMREHCMVLGNFTELLAAGTVTQIRITASEVVIETASGLMMTWDVTQLREPTTLLVIDGQYEAAETLLLSQLASRARAFIDIGANVGYFSLTLAQSAPRLLVCSIEPSSDTCTRLTRNIALNSLQERITVVSTAVGDKPGTALLYKPGETGNVGASLANLHPDEPTSTEPVSVRLLDEVVEDFVGKERDVLMKMDVEGAEDRALRGATKTLDVCFAVVVELSRKWLQEFGARATDVVSLLRQVGFLCYAIEARDGEAPLLSPTTEITEGMAAVNFLFLHESVAGEISHELSLAGFALTPS